MRVITLNLWGRHGVWDDRRRVLIDGLHQLQPDIAVLQEVVVTDDYDQAADLFGPDYHIFHQPGRTDDGVGASIVSRWPLAPVRTASLHLTPRIDPAVGWIGSVTALRIETAEVGAVLLVHHKPSWQWNYEYERELQAVASARLIEALLDSGESNVTHVVLAGDFDAAPDAASIRFWRGLQSLDGTSVCYADAWETARPGQPGHTFTPYNPLVTGGEMPLERGRRIDYIFVRCNHHGPTLRTAACNRIFDAPVDGVWASDHFGVMADLVRSD